MAHNNNHVRAFLTIELGVVLSFGASALWGGWSLINGLSNMLMVRREEDVVARFGPHFNQPNLVINRIGDWMLGPSSVTQTYAGSYLMMEGCVNFCDVVVGSSCLCLGNLFFILFSKDFFCGGHTSVSRLKGRVKFWLALWIFAWIMYVGGFAVDAGNIILSLPPEAHSSGIWKIGLRFLLLPIPSSHILFIVLWYRKLRSKEHLEKHREGLLPLTFENLNHHCSCAEWGCHIFWILEWIAFMLGYVLFIIHYKSLYKILYGSPDDMQ